MLMLVLLLRFNMQISMSVVKNFLDPNHRDHLPFVKKLKELFYLIKDLQRMNGWAFCKLDWLAWRLGICERYVQKLLAVLRGAKLIEVDRKEKNYYRITPFLIPPGSAERDTPPSRKSQKRAARQKLDQQSQATLEVGTSNNQNQFSEAEEAAILAAYQATQTVEVAATTPSEPVIEPMATSAEPTVEPEIKEAVEEAAKEVRRAKRYVRPKSIGEYLSAVKALLTAWEIEAPRLLIGDVVLKFWMDTW
jgi:hypothetical protein